MKFIQISDFKLGSSIQGFYLCKEKHLRHTRGGDLFIDMIFSDATGIIPGKLWDMADQFNDRFNSGDPVAVKGKVTAFNEQLQIVATHINKATDEQYGKYGYSADILIKTVKEPLDSLWKNLTLIINSLKKPYKKLIQTIFNKYEQKIRVIPGSVHYYPIRGGFLKHLVTTSRISMDILSYYPTIDKDLVLSGILLHNIGMVESINDDLQPSYSDAGRLVGHVTLGIEILKKTASSLKNFPADILLKLEHIILSHGCEGNSRRVDAPRLPEALFINYIDALDDRLNIMMDVINYDVNSKWTDNHNFFQLELYKK